MSWLSKLFGGAATKPVTWLQSADLEALLKKPAPPLVIDVRETGEFTGPLGHIRQARNIPLGQIPERAPELLGTGRQIVLVCRSDKRASMAAKQLLRSGDADIAVLRGGMMAWQSRTAPR